MHKCLTGLFTLFLILLSACNPADDKEESIVFHYNQHNNITSLDPAFAKSQNNIWAVNHIFSTLLRLNDSLSLIPGIARDWSISDDGCTYTFFLRDDVSFHPSECFQNDLERRVTAQDVVYSFNRLLDTTLNAPGSWIFANRVNRSNAFSAPNDTTFILQLLSPFAPLPSLLTMQYCSIVPEEVVVCQGSDFYRNPIGSGPFVFKKWVENQGLFLVRNEDYYGWIDRETSNLKGIRTSFIGERSITFLELVNGRVDFFSGLESSFINTALSPDGQLRASFRDQINFIKSPYLNFEYLGINPQAPGAHPLLRQRVFRQALNYGIDRELMLRSLRNGIGVPADAGVITRGLPSYNPEIVRGYEFDRFRARQILAQLDPEYFEIPLTIHTSKDYLDLTTYIAKQWEYLGLDVAIEVMESAVLRNAMRTGEVGLFRASWIADYPDGESFLSMFYSQNPAPPNYTRYANSSFDDRYRAALVETDTERKISLYQKMDQILVDDAPVIFLFYDEISLFTSNEVSGISRNALNLLQVDNIKKSL